MKFFGGNQRGATSDNKQDKKKVLAGETSKGKRITLIILSIIVIILTVALVVKAWIQPPKSMTSADNDTTVVDVENGDAITISGANRKSDYFTFFVGATDEDGTRTDSMMMISFDNSNKKINVLNIPRDTMSNVSRNNKKINGAFNNGIEGTRKEVQKLLGFPFDKHMVVSFDGIAEIVDAIGGVEYDVPINMYYDDPSQNLHIHIKKGLQHMDGQTTVEFLRWRKNNDGTGYLRGDIDRVEKQQEFLQVLAQKILKPTNILKIPKICEAVFNNVQTDITMGEMIWLGLQAMNVGSDQIEMFTLPGEAKYVGSLSYYLPDEDDILEMVNLYFNPYKSDITDLDIANPSNTSDRPTSSSNKKNNTEEDDDLPIVEENKKPSGSNNGSTTTKPEETDKDNNSDQKPSTGTDDTTKPEPTPEPTPDPNPTPTPEPTPEPTPDPNPGTGSDTSTNIPSEIDPEL